MEMPKKALALQNTIVHWSVDTVKKAAGFAPIIGRREDGG